MTVVPEIHGRIVTTPNGRLLRRVGGDSQPLRGDAMTRFVRDRSEHSGEEEQVAAITPADLDLEAVNQAPRRRESSARRTRRCVPRLGELRRRPSTRPASRVRNPPGGRRPLRRTSGEVRQGAAVQLVRREGIGPGPGPSVAREECVGPVPRILDCCQRFVARHTRRYEAVTGVPPRGPSRIPRSGGAGGDPQRPRPPRLRSGGRHGGHHHLGTTGSKCRVRPVARPHHYREHAARALQPQPKDHAGAQDDGARRGVRGREWTACSRRWNPG